MLETVEIEPTQAARHTVIWLHGLGADGHDFEPIVPELKLPDELAVRFVFPHAPVRPVTLNGGMPMRAWYDILSLDRDGPQDEAGIRQAMGWVTELIGRERERGIDDANIVLAGFSQGGAIALNAGLRHPQRLAGIMGLSTWLPLADKLGDEAHEANAGQEVFQAHGQFDDIIPVRYGELSRDALQAAGHTVQWQAYPMAHQVVMEEITACGQWLKARFG